MGTTVVTSLESPGRTASWFFCLHPRSWSLEWHPRVGSICLQNKLRWMQKLQIQAFFSLRRRSWLPDFQRDCRRSRGWWQAGQAGCTRGEYSPRPSLTALPSRFLESQGSWQKSMIKDWLFIRTYVWPWRDDQKQSSRHWKQVSNPASPTELEPRWSGAVQLSPQANIYKEPSPIFVTESTFSSIVISSSSVSVIRPASTMCSYVGNLFAAAPLLKDINEITFFL